MVVIFLAGFGAHVVKFGRCEVSFLLVLKLLLVLVVLVLVNLLVLACWDPDSMT